MLKREYIRHIEEMTRRVRHEEWAELEKNKRDFIETGDTWLLSWLGHLTVMDAALYHETGEETRLAQTRECLAVYLSLQDEMVRRYEAGTLPFMEKREDGRPIEGPSRNPLEVLEENETDPWNFQIVETIFSFTPVLRALYLVGRDAFTEAEWKRLEVLCYAEINHIFRDCEWGRHNRATMRAVTLLLFAVLFPENAAAARCEKLADMLFEDSLGNWSVEDATSYLGLWLNNIAEYTWYRGVWNFRIEEILSYYCHYFTAMLLPSGGLPEFGDTRFDSGTSTCLTLGVMELMAKRHHDGVLKYTIERQFCHMVREQTMDNGLQYERGMTNALLWADDSILPEEPNILSCEVLDELVGKKAVFRDGWREDSVYLLYNYRDVGPYGKLTRDYLQKTIPVHAEKPHHGHADEQSVCALCAGGAVLLRDGGYRDSFTTNGHYRADFYHNRLVMRTGRMFREKGFLEYVENIGDYLPVRTEKLFFHSFACAEVIKTRLYDDFHRADADRHVIYLKAAKLFAVVDTVHPRAAQDMTTGVMYHAEHIAPVEPGVYRVQEETAEGLTHFYRYRSEPRPHTPQSLCIAFAKDGVSFSTEAQRRNYRQETALSCYTSRYFGADEYFSYVSLLIPETGKTARETEGSCARALEIAHSLRVTHTHMGRSLTVRLAADGTDYTIGIQCDDQAGIEDMNLRPAYSYECGRAVYGAFETDAKFLISDGCRYGMIDGTRVDYEGRTQFAAYPNRCNQLDFVTVLQRAGTWGSYEDTLDGTERQ
ncbi:MAG: hypothetical protein ACI4QB_10030 [Eubacteriales bacterium]